MNRLPRLPFILEHLAADRQRRTYALGREQHALTVSRVKRCNSALSDALKQ